MPILSCKSLTVRIGTGNVGQEVFTVRVTVQDTMFSSLFVINDKVQCHLCILGPFRGRGMGSVSGQISSPVPGEPIVLVLSDGPRSVWGCFRHGINRVINDCCIFQSQRLDVMCCERKAGSESQRISDERGSH
jgi:hypothetical protein